MQQRNMPDHQRRVAHRGQQQQGDHGCGRQDRCGNRYGQQVKRHEGVGCTAGKVEQSGQCKDVGNDLAGQLATTQRGPALLDTVNQPAR